MKVCSSGKIVGLLHALQVTIHPEVDGVRIDGKRFIAPKQPDDELCVIAAAPMVEINDDGRESEKSKQTNKKKKKHKFHFNTLIIIMFHCDNNNNKSK